MTAKEVKDLLTKQLQSKEAALDIYGQLKGSLWYHEKGHFPLSCITSIEILRNDYLDGISTKDGAVIHFSYTSNIDGVGCSMVETVLRCELEDAYPEIFKTNTEVKSGEIIKPDYDKLRKEANVQTKPTIDGYGAFYVNEKNEQHLIPGSCTQNYDLAKKIADLYASNNNCSTYVLEIKY